MPQVPERVVVENATLNFRNFEGRESRFGKSDRNFGVVLDNKTAQQMQRDGWNVKFPDPREEGEERDPYIVVSVGYKIRPPRIVMVTSAGKVSLSEKQIQVLDWADIRSADVIFSPGVWEVNGKTGIKAWLKTLVVTIEEDELERKYRLNEDEAGLQTFEHDEEPTHA